MTTIIDADPAIGWSDPDDAWLSQRRHGIGASEVAAALGLPGAYATPWQVWADKMGLDARGFDGNEATELGNALEPWLLQQAARKLGCTVNPPPYRLYAHREHPWKLASPDGIATLGDGELVEAKTAGLLTQWAARNWTEDDIPLPYEVQARWQMHVLNKPVVHVPGLIVGFGLKMWRVERDLATERQLVDAVTDWWHSYVVARREPPMLAGDSKAMDRLWPTSDGETIALDGTDVLDITAAYWQAHAVEKAAKADKDAYAAELKRMLAGAEVGTVTREGSHPVTVVTWKPKASRINYGAMCAELDIDPEPWRPAPGRSLLPKKVKP